MTDHSTQDDAAGMDDPRDVASEADRPEDGGHERDRDDGIARTEAYRHDDVVVFFDAWNPLAWIEADSAVRVDRLA